MAKRTAPKPSRRSRLTAATADKYALYRDAVQAVEAEIDFLDEAFKDLRGRRASTLREDFCSTANTACEWVRRRPSNTAVGLDIDPEPLAWADEHNLSTLTPSQRRRITLLDQNVLTADKDARDRGGFDMILAMNFSYWCFHSRAMMLDYFTSVRKSLVQPSASRGSRSPGTKSPGGGVFFLDHYGGPESLSITRERSEKEGFTYIWNQAEHNAINGHLRCTISFAFPDGTRMRDAFTYDWRHWSLPELRDILADAGFSKTTVYWEGDDGEGGGDGNFVPTDSAQTCPAYITYIAAEI